MTKSVFKAFQQESVKIDFKKVFVKTVKGSALGTIFFVINLLSGLFLFAWFIAGIHAPIFSHIFLFFFFQLIFFWNLRKCLGFFKKWQDQLRSEFIQLLRQNALFIFFLDNHHFLDSCSPSGSLGLLLQLWHKKHWFLKGLNLISSYL